MTKLAKYYGHKGRTEITNAKFGTWYPLDYTPKIENYLDLQDGVGAMVSIVCIGDDGKSYDAYTADAFWKINRDKCGDYETEEPYLEICEDDRNCLTRDQELMHTLATGWMPYPRLPLHKAKKPIKVA